MWSAAPCPRFCPSCARRASSRWNGTASGSSSSPARRPLPEGWRGTRRARSQTAAAACTNGRGAHLPAAGKTAGFPGPFRKALFLVKSFPFFFALLFRTVEAEGFPYALKGRPMGTPRWAGRLIRLFCYGSAFAEKLRPRSWSPYRKNPPPSVGPP